MLIMQITSGNNLLCELYVVGSDETVQVCAVKYMCEYEQHRHAKMHFTAGKFGSNFTGCSHTIWLPLQSAMSFGNQKDFGFCFLRMNYLLLGGMILRGS